ncbi:hypothetical protein C8Q77DRAFT_87377 [Trametes polyzona]|nr:hypothetical protein C8Q77DRAFT_87377 [Trametes polyzona]
MPRLPLELTDYIVDFLHEDARTLAVCAHVSRSWAPAARFHLFRSVVLQDHSFASSFQRLLGTAPDLGYYVRELTIAKFVSATEVTPAKSVPSVEDALPGVFVHLPHLRSLTLAHLDLKDVTHFKAIRHSSLSEVTFSYCQFADFADIVDFINSFPSLAKLSIAGLTWKEERRPPAVRPMHSLRTLVLGRETDSERLFDWFAAAGLHTSITSLTARCASERDTDLVGPFLTLAGPSLRELDLDWSFSGDKTIVLPPTVTLAACTALEFVRLRFPVHYSIALPWVVSLLDTLGDDSAVRALALNVRLLGSLDALDWAGLNRALAKPAFSALAALDVGVNLWPGVHKDLEEVEGVVRERLASFEKKGVVQFSGK